MTPAEAFMEELATRVVDKVEERLRTRPVVQPRLLTIHQVAVLLGRTPDAVRKMIERGKLKNASPDGRVQIDTRDIEVLIQSSNR